LGITAKPVLINLCGSCRTQVAKASAQPPRHEAIAPRPAVDCRPAIPFH
jgi:hypothetical protein